jgi:hypothetical protein
MVVIRLLTELRRRKVFRVAGIYAAACRLIVEVAGVGFGAFTTVRQRGGSCARRR